nr:receptor likey region, transmembrane domain- and ring domain-containing protein 3 [Quercus suber]
MSGIHSLPARFWSEDTNLECKVTRNLKMMRQQPTLHFSVCVVDSIPLDAGHADGDAGVEYYLLPTSCAFVGLPSLSPNLDYAPPSTMSSLSHRVFTATALLCLAVQMMAQSPTPANFTNQQQEQFDAWLSLPNPIGSMTPAAALLPFTPQADMALSDYDGYITASYLTQIAESANVAAIIFYSHEADFCEPAGVQSNDSYRWQYSLQGQNRTQTVLSWIEVFKSKGGGNDTYISVERNTTTLANAGAPTPTGSAAASNSSSSGDDGGPPPTTAVAMIILYSITGVITCLFLIIIITGAIRAHRHPERYGPRNILGRARQSRAQGLARAMLDSLPIVKFGEQENNKPGDVEMVSGDAHDQSANVPSSDETNQRSSSAAVATGGSDSNEPNIQSAEQEDSGIAAAVAAERSGGHEDNHESEGCSICTEDFELGQDQRVLPCNHRFHPACIDPWLLNISGTCPLCRIDLRPQGSSTDETSNEELIDGMAPPLGLPSNPTDRERLSVRRSLMLSIIGMGQPDRMSRQQRVSALREYNRRRARGEHGVQDVAALEAPSEEEEMSTRRRLRNAFRIRTRRTGQANDEVAQAGEAFTTAEGRRGFDIAKRISSLLLLAPFFPTTTPCMLVAQKSMYLSTEDIRNLYLDDKVLAQGGHGVRRQDMGWQCLVGWQCLGNHEEWASTDGLLSMYEKWFGDCG